MSTDIELFYFLVNFIHGFLAYFDAVKQVLGRTGIVDTQFTDCNNLVSEGDTTRLHFCYFGQLLARYQILIAHTLQLLLTLTDFESITVVSIYKSGPFCVEFFQLSSEFCGRLPYFFIYGIGNFTA